MTNIERLDKFKTLYKCKKGFKLIVGITEADKFLGVVYKEIEIVSRKTGIKDIAEGHIKYVKVNTIQEFIEQLTLYIIKNEILIEAV